MACASRGLEQRVGTLLASVGKPHKLRSLHLEDLLGTVRARRNPGIEEVDVERTRRSKTNREHFQGALAPLFVLVSLFAFVCTDRLGDPLLTNQVLCKFVDHVNQTGGKIGLGRHAI